MLNPFNPTLGVEPPILIDRAEVLDSVCNGIAAGPGNPYRATFVTGQRGYGKTVLLAEIAERLESEHGYITVSVDCLPTMLEDIIDQMIKKTRHLMASDRIQISGFNIMSFGLELAIQNQQITGWRTRFEEFLELLTEQGAQVLIAVD